jgi:alkylation response protein AidB-like acyl-CoA dehydrogenase
MDFSLNEETILVRDNARRFLEEKCPSTLVREMAREEKGFSTAIWREMAELGWLGLIHDEAYGGIGGTFVDLAILFEEMGRALLPSPFFCSVILSGLTIQEAGDARLKDAYLPGIVTGEKIWTLSLLDAQGRYDYHDPKLGAKEVADGSYVLSGTRILVPYAHVAYEIVVCAKVTDSRHGGPTLFKADPRAQGLKISPLDTLTEEKTFVVVFQDVSLCSGDIIGTRGRGNTYIEKILPKAIVCKCAEMLGGLERVIEMTVGYARERHQFGRPLGSLQVVQHYCADMATYLETTRLITYQAASLLSKGIPCDKEVSMAKAWCSDAYKRCTWMAHQIHGGIGFTEEHDLHLYYKHAKASELDFGDSWFHRRKVAEAIGM